MASFDDAFELIIKQEGGFNDHKNDNGGATKYGISLSFLRGLGVFGDLDNDGDVDITDIRKLNIEDAKKLYEKHFWKELGVLRNQRIANYIFSIAVNAGNRRAAILTQTSLNRYVRFNNIIVDGIVGEKTLESINGITNILAFTSILTVNLIDFYRSLVNKNRDQSVFLLGWINRAFDCLNEL